MFTQLSTSPKATIFYAIAFVLALLIAIFGQGMGNIITVVSMFTPLAAVLLMLLVVTRDGYTREGWQILGLHRLGFRAWGMTFLLPLLIMGFTYGIVWATGFGRLDLSGFGGPVNLTVIGYMLLGVLMTTIYAFAEEIGWRGYLLPNLLPLGRTRALLLSGLLHGIWHLPVMLLTPFYHDGGNRFLVAALFVLTLTAAGVFYGYLRLTSESVWPATLAHSFLNTVWTWVGSKTIAVASPLLLEYLAGESGILTLIAVAAASSWLLYRLHQQPKAASTGQVLASQPVGQV